jgi:hydroxyethylthiazole kinase-like uncharacterized protein yjeF
MPLVEIVTPDLLRDWPLPGIDDDGDKLDRGSIHVVGGAVSTPGAVLLAGLAALRVGAGRLTITTVTETAAALGVAVPEAMVVGAEGVDGSLSRCSVDQVPEAFVVGPGILAPGKLVRSVLKHCDTAALVVDAVALHDLPRQLPARTVLTPNDRELISLAGRRPPSDPAALTQHVSDRYQAVVVSQDWVAAPDGRLWHSPDGSAVLATSGSGDVLAGIVGGLLARGADPAQAAVWGQYLHAAAGERIGRIGLLARELLDELPAVLADLSV